MVNLLFLCQHKSLFVVVFLAAAEIELKAVNVIRLWNAILTAGAVGVRLNNGYAVRLEMRVKLVNINIKNILAELEELARYTVKQVVILVEGELDREKHRKTDAVALCLCLKISIAELVHLFGKGEMLAELLEMVGREMVGYKNGIVTRFLEKPYLLDG